MTYTSKSAQILRDGIQRMQERQARESATRCECGAQKAGRHMKYCDACTNDWFFNRGRFADKPYTVTAKVISVVKGKPGTDGDGY